MTDNRREVFPTYEDAKGRHDELYLEYGILLDPPFHDTEFNCWILQWDSPNGKIFCFDTEKEGDIE